MSDTGELTMQLNYKLDLSRYNLVELEVLLETGVLTVTEFEAEKSARGLMHETVTPPDSRRGD